MATLRPAPVSTRQVLYDAQRRLFVADISDTHGFGRVYDDACDEGLTLVSHLTGKEVVFAVWNEARDGEGGVQYWLLRATDGSGLTLKLFND
jgi:hypothetical protein